MLCWILTTALASAPTAAPMVTVDWAGNVSTVEVWAPLDLEVAPDAPAVVELFWADKSVRWVASGAALADGVRLGTVRGESVTGRLSLSLCDKRDGTCVQSEFALKGWASDHRRGQAILKVEHAAPTAPPTSGHHAPEYKTDAAALADAAFAAASRDDKRVILDFGAVWCPPCNLLSAQVLHAPDPPAILDEYRVAVIDSDDPRSFELKSRYNVTGYPTVIVAGADGAEISRQIGYPGREEMVAWLVRAAAQVDADTDFSLVDPAGVDPDRAAEIAWLLAESGGDAKPWIARAEGSEKPELRLARVVLDPNLQDAGWLADNAPGTAGDWVYPALALSEKDDGRAVIRRALEADLRGKRGSEASDLLYLLAETAPEAEKSLIYAASAAALRSALTGDPALDRGHYTWLAVLTERSGDLDGAVALLTESAERWPTEPTFHLALASTWLRSDRPEDSLLAAQVGMDASWGDNKLRMAESVCKALGALDRAEEARAVAAAALAESPAPTEELAVRTHRYRATLQAIADGAPK